MEISYLKILFAFIVVAGLLGLFWLVLHYHKKHGFLKRLLPAVNGGRSAIKVEEKVSLDAHNTLVKAQVSKQNFLILLGKNNQSIIELKNEKI